MRKVIYSEYVQNGINETISSHSYSSKPAYELQEQGEALFHQWGRDTHSDEDGSFSTAIIELEDGIVKNIPAYQVRFISGPIVETNVDTMKELKKDLVKGEL